MSQHDEYFKSRSPVKTLRDLVQLRPLPLHQRHVWAVVYADRYRPDVSLVSVIREDDNAINAVIGSRRDNKSWLGPNLILHSVERRVM